MTGNPVLKRLQHYAKIGDDDARWLLTAASNSELVPADHEFPKGDKRGGVHLLLEGIASRCKHLADGRRQITAFLIAGDHGDLHAASVDGSDHTTCALSPCTVATIPFDAYDRAMAERPGLQAAFLRSERAYTAVLREWMINIGRRDAYQRVAHLIWELFLRHALVGRTQAQSFNLPLTQIDMADALALSNVHINRTLQRLKAEGVIDRGPGGVVTLLDAERLIEIAEFDPGYLNIGHGNPGGEILRRSG